MAYKETIAYLNNDKIELNEIARHSDHAEEVKLIASYIRSINATMEIVEELGRRRNRND